MMEWAIGAIASAAAGTPPDLATRVLPAPSSEPASSFAALLRNGVGELNADLRAAEVAMSGLAAGKGVELHDVMIALERAQLSVQTFVQVRNKLVEAYQDLTRMQL